MVSTSTSNVSLAIDLLLKAVSRRTPPSGDREYIELWRPLEGAGLSVEASPLLDAALFIRRNASPHLASLSVEALQKMLLQFIEEQLNVWKLDFHVPLEGENYAVALNAYQKEQLADAMAQSPIFAPATVLFLFPITVLQIDASFRGESFFLVPPSELLKELPSWCDPRDLAAEKHPPFSRMAKTVWKDVSCWLGVRAPVDEIAFRTRDAILGSIALLPHPLLRYQFTIATVPAGYVSFSEAGIFHSGQPSTPSLSEMLSIGQSDHEWLHLLERKLASKDRRDRKAVLALQYFYRAWRRDPASRIAPLCGALEAVFSDREAATQAMVDAVGNFFDTSFDATRARRLAKLRAGVIHGGAPNIYEASVYQKYFTDYREDPVRDLEIVTARCLQRHIFAGALVERPHPYASLLKQQ